jgi:hypothetical protein
MIFLDVLLCHLATDQEVLMWQKPVSAAEKPLGSELLLSGQIFLAQGGPGQKFIICPVPPGNELSEYVFFL